MKIVSATVIAALTATLACPAATAQQDTLRADTEAIRQAGGIGVLTRVDDQHGTRSVTAGVAERNTTRAMPAATHFRIGSATKTFTATVVLQLAAEGKLSLEDSIEQWLPDVLQGNGYDGRTVTLRQLLRHQSGIFDYSEDTQFAADMYTVRGFSEHRYDAFTAQQLVGLALRNPPRFAPGSKHEYSNTNYVLLGMVITKVTGTPWEKQILDRILRPLNLRETTLPGHDPRLPTPYVHGYELLDGSPERTDTTEFTVSWGDAAGALISTAQDLNTFYRALLSRQLLPPDQLRQMQDTVPVGFDDWPGAGYGLGLVRFPLSCGGAYWGHGGDAPGFRTRQGVSADGRRSVTIFVTTRTAAIEKATWTLLDHALCGR
ncbi:class A beta-lactamase-related serine hydrolase [Pseudonocardiaceae bacterium YIM PH 21723]|nr:class A beta-lactamase-related serine hydrolase [Pseudonocardiaceae bacterium YIM PH 21723]